MSDETEQLEGQAAQREGAKRATLELMRGKKPREQEFTTSINGEEASFHYKAIGSRAYDRMLNEAPPTVEQMARGERFDEDKFSPRLLAKVIIEPQLTEEEWAEIWKSPDWSRGELAELVNNAVSLCNRGLDLSPTSAG